MRKHTSIPSKAYRGQTPRVRGSKTSAAAADAVMPRAGSLRAKILNMILKCGEASCDEVEETLSLAHQNASARIRELVLSGHLERSNRQRRTRLGGWGDILIPTRLARSAS